MTRRTRIHIDRLVLDGLASNTRPHEVEAAVRHALAHQLAGATPAAASVPRLDLTARTASPAGMASEVAGGIARAARRRP
jgi:hypothetical protein